MNQPESIYTSARLAPSFVADLVAEHYALPEPVSGRFYAQGLHDNYLIQSGAQKFILRVYTSAWRSEEEICFELDLLTFLHQQAAPVAFPLRTKTDAWYFLIDSPAGQKVAALFNYADGAAPRFELSVAESALLGSTIANIHRLSDTFKPLHRRTLLDIPYLVDESLIAITPYLEVEARAYLGGLREKLAAAIAPLSKESPLFGICIGDVNTTNFHINASQQITVFDFDQCGYGYRAFEIGKYISSIHVLPLKQALAAAFIEGYQQVRQLTPAERNAIPYFEMVGVIWVMAINAYNVGHLGFSHLDKPFWDRRLMILKSLESALPQL